jgi:hypothetical protein
MHFECVDFAQGKKDVRVVCSLWNSCALPSEKNLITYFCEPWLKDHPAMSQEEKDFNF